MRLAVAGKGGSGKSVLTGTLARVLARRGHRVLALDSDPLPGLAISLGLGPAAESGLRDAVAQDQSGRFTLRKGIGPVRAVQRYAVTAPDGVRLLQFDKAAEDGLKRSMPSVQAFLAVASRLAQPRALGDWALIGDLSAGPRQPAFGWAPYAKTVLTIAEPTAQSILTARRIARIAGTRRGVTVLFVANKVASTYELELVERKLGRPLFFVIPADPAVRDADRGAAALLDHAPSSPAARAIAELAERLETRTLNDR